MFGLYFWLFLFGFNYILSYLACLSWLLFFCCHRLVLITTFQNMRSSMLSFGSHVGKELNVLNIVVLNARVSIGFTFRGVLLFIVLQLCNSCWCFFFKSQSWFVLQQMEFSFGCLARQVVVFDLVICSLSLSYFCICYSYNPQLISTVSGCFNSLK